MGKESDKSLPDLSSWDSGKIGNAGPRLGEQPLDEPMLKLGPYRVICEIGRGGMGVVYLAIQEHPVERKVALKVIQNPVLAKTIIAECKSLAAMSHPNVAVIFDGGEDPISSLPYFAMEYVDGQPLSTYCQQHRLSIKERLAIFVELCNGVQHAHKKRVIHRDLKPANVLVIERDGRAIPKVIDFGLSADLLDNRASGGPSGTWAYMSPEQAKGDLLDTQTDIYSLSVILHELLTGKRPIESSRFINSSDPVVVQRNVDLIATETPLRTSQVFAEGTNALEFSRTCPVDVSSHQKTLKNDFDFIIAKGLNKDPELRYDSAKSLADDVLRVTKHEVPRARPFSRGYSFKKFVRRNAAVLAATALLFLVSLGGAITSSIGWLKAIESQKVAEAAQAKETTAKEAAVVAKLEETIAKEEAEREAANANFQLANYFASQNRVMDSKRSFSQIPPHHRGIEWWLKQKAIDTSDFTCFAHTSLVSDVCFSPSGRWVVSAGRDAQAVVWEVETGNMLQVLPHEFPVVSADFSPDGSKVATSSEGGGLSIWSARSGKLIKQSLLPSGADATCVRFDWDGEKVIAGASHEVVAWDYSGEAFKTIHVHSADVVALCLSSDGKSIASSSRARDIQVWNLETGKVIAQPIVEFPKVQGVSSDSAFNHVVSMDFSPDGKSLAFSIASSFGSWPAITDNLRVWDFEGQRVVKLAGHDGGTSAVKYSPDGRSLISVGYDNLVKTWSTRDFSLLHSRHGHGQPVESLDVSPDGSRLATAGGTNAEADDEALLNGPFDYGVKFWSLKTELGSHVIVPSGKNGTVSFQMTADGSRAFLTTGKSLKVLEIDNGAEESIQLSGDASKVVLSRDEKRLAVLIGNEKVVVLEAASGQFVNEINTGEGTRSITFTKNCKNLIVVGSDHLLTSCNVDTGKLTSIGNVGSAVLGVFCPDDGQCVTVGRDQSIRTWDLTTRSQTRCINFDVPQDQSSDCVCLSKDGSTLAIAIGHKIQLFDIKFGKLIGSLEGYGDRIKSLEFSNDKSKLFSSGEDHVIRIWNLETEKEILQLDTGEVVADELFLSNDQRKFVCFSDSGELHLFCFPEEPFVRRLQGHRFPVYAVEFPGADGELLYSRSKKSDWSNEEWLVWDLKTGKLMDVKDLKKRNEKLQVENQKLKPEFEFTDISPGNKCAECQISTDGDWTAVPSGNEIVVVQRPEVNSFEALSRLRKSQIDPGWHYQMGMEAKNERDDFAAAIHFAWAMRANPDSELTKKFKVSFDSLSEESQSLLLEKTKAMDGVSSK